MSLCKLTASALAITAASATVAGAQSAQPVHIAGSSTVLPYASIVADVFGENSDFPDPGELYTDNYLQEDYPFLT